MAGGRGGRGLTCPGGIGAAALYSRGGPGAGLEGASLEGASERGSRLLPRRADGRRTTDGRTGAPRGEQAGAGGAGRGAGRGAARGSWGAGLPTWSPGRGEGAGAAFCPSAPKPILPQPAQPPSPRGRPLDRSGVGGRLRVTTAHGPRRWHGRSEKLSRVPRRRLCAAHRPAEQPPNPSPGPAPSARSPLRWGGGRPGPRSVTLAAGPCPLPPPAPAGAPLPPARPNGVGRDGGLSRRASSAVGLDGTAARVPGRPGLTSTCCRLRGRPGPAALLGAGAQLGCAPGSTDEKCITEKYRIWMKGGEAQRVAAPLSLSPPAGSRGLWEGLAEVASAKVPPAGWVPTSRTW